MRKAVGPSPSSPATAAPARSQTSGDRRSGRTARSASCAPARCRENWRRWRAATTPTEVAKLRVENWPSSEIGQDLHPVHEGEEDHGGADQRQLVEALRQDVDLIGRRADLDQKRHEAGHARPRARPSGTGGRCGRSAAFAKCWPQPRAEPSVEHEGQADRADGQFDRGIGHRTGEQRAQRHADAPRRASALSDSRRSRRGDRSTPK